MKRHIFVVESFVLLACVVVIASLAPEDAFGQALVDPFTTAQLEVKPPFPAPNQEIQLVFKSNDVAIGSALITWYVNGDVVQQGYGKKNHRFVVGSAGTHYAIRVTAVEPSGKSTTYTADVRVGDISFVWEAKTYTPPFFGGRALYSPGSEVVVMAVPVIFNDAGAALSSDNLVFDWEVYKNIENRITGRGRDSVTLKTKLPFDAFTITLTVKDLRGEIRAIKTFTVPSAQPKIVFYEDSPLLGILYGRALNDSYSMAGEEVLVTAEPFYIAAQSRIDAGLSYEWDVSGQKLNTPGGILLRPSGAGTAPLSVSIADASLLTQRAQGRLTVTFGQGSSGMDTANPSTNPL